jgi:aspartate 4-decarboxylase
MKAFDPASLAKLSPFELKDTLVALASNNADRMMLNAGRGNPNFLATLPRHAFFQLGLFALQESERSFAYMPEGVGGLPLQDSMDNRFDAFVTSKTGLPGVAFLAAGLSYVRDHLGLSASGYLHEIVSAILGCEYPTPPRILPFASSIACSYLARELFDAKLPASGIDLFAVEGGTAGITYVFNTLRENRLLAPGDKIAIGMPIFTPYIEVPQLDDYQLIELNIEADAANGWQYPESEIERLADPTVKAFFVVNPGNPTSAQICASSLRQISELVRLRRPDLIIISDEVYGTFADGFVSLFAACPQNTILVYSFSKHFGATGLRLGLVATHQQTVLDRALATLPEAGKKALDQRYQSLSAAPRDIKFIDRLVADSRTVALNHTAGLSTPQQVQMAFFCLVSLMDETDAYRNAIKRVIHRRHAALYQELGLPVANDPNGTGYYALLDLEQMATEMHGAPFAKWILAKKEPLEMLFRLAGEGGVVLLPGEGFGALHPSARVSLANLNEHDYARIGHIIRKLADEYYAEFLDGQASTLSVT